MPDPWAIRDELARQHDAMNDAQRRRVLLVEYHCADRRRCLLLRVWATTHGPAFYRPRYTVSPARNLDRSSPEGRAANTRNGSNDWRANCGRWMDVGGLGPIGWPLNCDHVSAVVLAADVQADIESAQPGKPVRRTVARVSSPSDNGPRLLKSVVQN